MMYVKAKKALGQHFLKDETIAKRIVNSLILPPLPQAAATVATEQTEKQIAPTANQNTNLSKTASPKQVQVLEIGPGTGVLTKYLLDIPQIKLEVAEIDTESIEFLQNAFPQLLYSLQQRDFMEIPLEQIFTGDFYIIGNFPYNISSQIFFKILDYTEQVPQIVCMLQKEVAERLASAPGKKAYGILSVLLQAWYNIEYLFTVDEHVFNPPPKVKSAVIRLTRNARASLGCDEALFKLIIKTCFNQRRKTIRNSIKPILGKNIKTKSGESINLPTSVESPLMNMRPEQLSVEQFIELTGLLLSC